MTWCFAMDGLSLGAAALHHIPWAVEMRDGPRFRQAASKALS